MHARGRDLPFAVSNEKMVLRHCRVRIKLFTARVYGPGLGPDNRKSPVSSPEENKPDTAARVPAFVSAKDDAQRLRPLLRAVPLAPFLGFDDRAGFSCRLIGFVHDPVAVDP